MKVIVGKKISEVETINSILSNGMGSFIRLGWADSQYQGWFSNSGMDVHKVVEELFHESIIESVDYKGWCVERDRGFLERVWMVPKSNTLVVETSKKINYSLRLDMRLANDLSEDNRNYSVYEKDGFTVIEINKNGFIYFLVVSGEFTLNENWTEYNYSYDTARHSSPSSRWIYQAGNLSGKKFIFSCGSDLKKTLFEHAKNVKGIAACKKRCKTLWNCGVKDIDVAKNACKMLESSDGYFAGYPWFTQVWSRDEMIALGGLDVDLISVLKDRFSKVKDGRLPNRWPTSDLGSSDSIGWAFKRLDSVLSQLSKKENEYFALIAKEVVDDQIKNYHKDGFFYNAALETWMDTSSGDDVRSGVRIEMQALMLVILDVTFKLTNEPVYSKLRDSLVKNVKSFMFKDYLFDGVGDKTKRPNVFLAYYLYPNLLDSNEWEKCFDILLDALWLDWGGVSTIDKSSSLFVANYSGQTNQSYHRGDSWFWVNNYVAICLNRVNKKKYSLKIKKILSASLQDIYFMGSVGCCSEVSSACEQTSSGCENQLWSASTLVELLRELKKK